VVDFGMLIHRLCSLWAFWIQWLLPAFCWGQSGFYFYAIEA